MDVEKYNNVTSLENYEIDPLVEDECFLIMNKFCTAVYKSSSWSRRHGVCMSARKKDDENEVNDEISCAKPQTTYQWCGLILKRKHLILDHKFIHFFFFVYLRANFPSQKQCSKALYSTSIMAKLIANTRHRAARVNISLVCCLVLRTCLHHLR